MSDRDRALALTPVSRETGERLDAFVALLTKWQAAKNLVSPTTLGEVWTRHIADSLQLIPYAGKPRCWLDLGSGAGFPGLVVAIAMVDEPMDFHLIESRSGKTAFLREAIRITGARAQVHTARLEEIIPQFIGKADLVTARALAPLADLMRWCDPLLKTGCQGLFLKGQDVQAELTAAQKCGTFEALLEPSLTDSRGCIVKVLPRG